MIRKLIAAVLILVVAASLAGCYTHTYTVGSGPQSGVMDQQRQWFALWGLVPINTVDTKAMVGNANDYTLKTEFTPVDVLIGFFTSFVSIVPRTVEVRK